MTSSSQSMEKKAHEERISNKIACIYLKEYQIPDQPSFDRMANIEFEQEFPREIIKIPLRSARFASLNYLKVFYRILMKVRLKIPSNLSNYLKF